MELYIGNNQISELKDIRNLKNLPKIIILDLSGNPLCKEQNYRIFTLFHLKKLKVLDGISIESGEQQLAKDTFTGRLTEETLHSRLIGIPANEIKILDLSNCKLRDFEDMFNCTQFPHLRDLNLSLNLFISLRPIGYLPHLRILNLSGNKIESLLIQNVNILESKIGLNGLHVL